jgi:hypothetical protein
LFLAGRGIGKPYLHTADKKHVVELADAGIHRGESGIWAFVTINPVRLIELRYSEAQHQTAWSGSLHPLESMMQPFKTKELPLNF